MRICIDIRWLQHVKTGIGKYTLNLLKALSAIDNSNEYIMFYNDANRHGPEDLPVTPNFKLIIAHWPHNLLSAMWAHTNFPAMERFVGKIDVLHALGFQVPPTIKAIKVFTIYDLVPLTHPQLAPQSKFRIKRPRFKFHATRADMVVAISQATANEAKQLLELPDEKVVVVYPGTISIDRAGGDAIGEMKKKFGLLRNYMLFVSTIDPRKNLPRLMRAFERSGLAEAYDLVLVGSPGWYMEETFSIWEELNCKKHIYWLKYVSDSDLSALYSGASFFVYPSLLEGFGLPILEAMSVGCPVLTSHVSAMPEAAGEAAVYVNPYEIDSIAEGLKRMAGNKELREKLSRMGYERVSQFSWDNAARQMNEVYKRASEIKK
jgi:glycosyltransferase involved in cell wall biosynthesis